jgi:uncharacterized protein
MHWGVGLRGRACVLWLWLVALVVQAVAELPTLPRSRVLDEPDVLSAAAEAGLCERLAAHERRTSNQVVVAIFKRLPENEILEEYAAKVGRAWALGTKERDNGLILFVFMQERTWRVATGYGLEGVLPDSLAERLLRQTLLPAFRNQQYEQGIDTATRALLQTIEKEYTADARPRGGGGSDRRLLWILLLFVAFVIWAHVGDTVFQRTGRFFLWQLFDILRLVMVGGGGSGGYSSSGGDDFRGGGGDFGGGGASGRW